MKKTFLAIATSLLLSFSFAGCSFSGANLSDGGNAGGNLSDDVGTLTPNDTTDSTDNIEVVTPDDSTTNEVISGNEEKEEEEEATGFAVNFNCGEHVTVTIYKTQDLTTGGEDTTVAYSRNSETGELSSDGTGQVNFVLHFDDGYKLGKITITDGYNKLKDSADTGVVNGYRITKITKDLTVTVTAEVEEQESENQEANGSNGENESQEEGENQEVSDGRTQSEKAEALGVTITCDSGTADIYTVDGNTITFGTIAAKSTYSISGELNGNIVIDVGNAYALELSLQGLTVKSADVSPIVILSGDKVTLSAKSGTTNSIYDNRNDVSSDDTAYSAAIYSTVDLALQGKGNLVLESANNNGIHTKDDLSVKNLTLKVKCVDNALKGNDGVTIESGDITLIATGGDCIKTSNSGLSSKNKQKGYVTISGGTIDLYAACDGIDAAYDVTISGKNTKLNIYTDDYSEYTGEIKKSSNEDLYIITSSNSSNYRYAVYFYNSDTEYEWQNATYYGTVRSGYSTLYAYKISRPVKYNNFAVYRFSASQTENSFETYSAATSGSTVNTNCNAYVLKVSSSTMSGSWATLTTSGDTYSSKGIKSDNIITISGGTVTIKSTDDCIHANYGDTLENGETGLGTINITGGDITLTSKDDAIHADYKLNVSDGNINVLSSYEGLEANLIELSGGTIYVKASDDGVNAAGSVVTPCITVSGTCYLDVTVGTGDVDGIDSNGDYVQTGGFVVTRDGTSDSGGMASGLDIDGTCKITGGTFICVGAIAETPSSSSECWVKFGSSSSNNMGMGGRPGGNFGNNSSSFSLTAGTYTVTDASGNELFTFTLSSSYNGLWIASDKFSVGNTYTLTNGTTTKTWTQSSNATSVS
jgi:hypothetical protein